MDLKYTYESDIGLQAVTDFVYHVFREEDKDYHLVKMLGSYLDAYQKLFEKRGYADSVSFTYSDEGRGIFHMTPLDDMTKAQFPHMCYFMYPSNVTPPEDMKMELKWHRHDPSELSLCVMKEVAVPTIEDQILDIPECIESLLDLSDGAFHLVLPLHGGEWKKQMEDLEALAAEVKKNPGVILVSRGKGKNHYFKPFHSFS
ncbi:MAG: hypothetical protein KBS81_00150 [Spirochaetales bacterium]|nr:hypothetical protein [Candidatus Physcosoma equi]